MILSRTPFFLRDPMQTCTHAAASGSQDQRNFCSVYLARVRILADMKVLYRAGSCVASSASLLCPPSRQIPAQMGSGRSGPAGGESDPL